MAWSVFNLWSGFSTVRCSDSGLNWKKETSNCLREREREREKSKGSNRFERERKLVSKKKFTCFWAKLQIQLNLLIWGNFQLKFICFLFLTYFNLNQNSSIFYYLREPRIISVFEFFVFVFDKLIFLFNFFINLYVDMTIYKCKIIFLNIILIAISAFNVPKVNSVYHIGLRTFMLVSWWQRPKWK